MKPEKEIIEEAREFIKSIFCKPGTSRGFWTIHTLYHAKYATNDAVVSNSCLRKLVEEELEFAVN